MSRIGSRSKPDSQNQFPRLIGFRPGSGEVAPRVRPGKGRSARSTAQGHRGKIAASHAASSSLDNGSSSSHRHLMFQRLLDPMCPVSVC